MAVWKARYVIQLTHTIQHYGKVVVREIVCVEVKVSGDVRELTKRHAQSMTQAIVELIAFKHDRFVFYFQQDRDSNHKVFLTLSDEARFRHLFVKIFKCAQMTITISLVSREYFFMHDLLQIVCLLLSMFFQNWSLYPI